MTTSHDLLKALDLAIQRASASADDSSARQLALDAIARALTSAPTERTPSSPPVAPAGITRLLLNPGPSPNPLLATALLRMLAVPRLHWLHADPWRAPVLTFIEACFTKAVYQDTTFRKAQSHRKLHRLSHLVKTQESDFAKVLKLDSLTKLRKHRQQLMKVLHGRLGEQLFVPCLPDDIDSTLDRFYESLTSYLDSDDTKIFDAWAIATRHTQHLITSCSDPDISYRTALARFGQRVAQLLEAHFSENPRTQPTTLGFHTPLKKYPLSDADRPFDVDFVVENVGEGYARDVSLLVEIEGATVSDDKLDLGSLEPSSRRQVRVQARVDQPVTTTTTLHVVATWQDINGTARDRDGRLTLYAQRGNLDWATLRTRKPYSLEPVSHENDLIGRRESLYELVNTVNAREAGSAVIKGQKRVGKSSLAKALKSNLENAGHVAVYIDAGRYMTADAASTVEGLGKVLVKELRKARPELHRVTAPEFQDALAPFGDYLDDCLALIPNTHVAIILDEFDSLPAALYRPGPKGEAFFQSLRSLTTRAEVSIILVGAERMDYVMEFQSVHVNKWNAIQVDYFDRSHDWTDYMELVRTPVRDSIEYTDDAIRALYEQSGGNPYFTNLICGWVYSTACDRKDSFVTREEINEAVTLVSGKSTTLAFSHFWLDGIREALDLENESKRRRRILVAVSGTMNQGSAVESGEVARHPAVRTMGGVGGELDHFVRRNVLEKKGNTYSFRVPLFGRWLRDRGASDLMAEYTDRETVAELRQPAVAQRISEDEMLRLVRTWGTYKGQTIGGEEVRGWLNQFKTDRERRAMFTMLQGLRLLSNAMVRQKLAEVAQMIGETALPWSPGGRKHARTLVSFLGGPGKSGAEFARLYADEMSIYARNVVEPGRIAEKLMAHESIERVVFVDDLVGTGDSVCKQLRGLHPKLVEQFQTRGTKVYYAVVLACEDGWTRVEQEGTAQVFGLHVRYCELIQDADRAFGVGPGRFDTEDEANFARGVAEEYGRRLAKESPLGYGECELSVVFEQNCPNNTLPILWKDSSEPNWTSLFSR